jgi:hypothetical protein
MEADNFSFIAIGLADEEARRPCFVLSLQGTWQLC